MLPEAKLEIREYNIEAGESRLLVDSRVLVPDETVTRFMDSHLKEYPLLNGYRGRGWRR